MITPRRTRLVRVPDLRAFRRAIALLSTADSDSGSSAAPLVVVPSQEAAVECRRTLDRWRVPLPDFVTREQMFDRFRARLAAPPIRLSAYEREVILQAACRAAIADGVPPPFRLRPGLVAEMLRFYDQLRRQGQSVARFAELIAESVDDETDRGAERMLRQTRFLAAAFRDYERRLAELGGADEHGLRDHLLRSPARNPIGYVIVAVADWIADPHGLFPADFDLLARIAGLERLDVIGTERVLRSGFHERLHGWLPGLDEADATGLGIESLPTPRLLVPGASPGPAFVCRDREEELIRVIRRIEHERLEPSRIAIVFERPLPYVYLAPEVFRGASIPHRTVQGLPLAAEPVAAALDLAIEFVSSQFSRASTIALLRCSQFRFDDDPGTLSREARSNLDFAMSDGRYFGDLDELRRLGTTLPDGEARAAAGIAIRLAEELQPLLAAAAASAQLTRLARFMTSHASPEGVSEREAGGRAALEAVLQSLAFAYASHDDRDATIDDLAPEIRRWVEDCTVRPIATGEGGVCLLDARAARFGDFDETHLVGAIEGEWPERPRRSAFYPPSLLASAGWPSERDRRGASSAAMLDLLSSPSAAVSISTVTLDDEALVEPATMLADVADAHLPEIVEPPRANRVFEDEAISIEPIVPERLDGEPRAWLTMRASRTDVGDPRYHGTVGPVANRAWSVSALETYITCPFKFFARHVLRLEEEPDDLEVMDPRQQGQFVHRVFQEFFTAWQDAGHGAITSANLDIARRLFEEVVERCLERLSGDEAALERTRLLGSPVAAGLGEIVFRIEAERPTQVVERLLEQKLDGEFEFHGPEGPRRIRLKGTADRVDLLVDGTFRLIDYKLSRAPQKGRALQLPIYGLCAEQFLDGRRGRHWTFGEASYIAFRGARRVAPLFTARQSREDVLAAAQARLIDVVDRIGAGEFPPTPEDVFLCGFCEYGSVCRKDYVGDV